MGKKQFIKNHLHDRELLQKLWQSFRIGQSTYVAYGIGLINFTLILYRLAGIDKYIEPIPFALILVAILLPTGVLIGIFHIRKQMPTENKIQAHNNPYVYKAVMNSKESMNIKTTLWQLDVSKVTNGFMIFQADMNKKLWRGINEISKKEIFTNEDMKQMDEISNNLHIIDKGIDDWKSKYQQLFEGKSVIDIPHANETYEIFKKN